MISLELLRKTGNVEALITLTSEDSMKVSELADVMDLHESTVRQRMNELGDTELVTASAEINDEGQPVRVWTVTEQGEQLATSLASLIDDYQAGDRSPAASDTGSTESAEGDD